MGRDFEIITRETVYDGFFRVSRFTLRHALFAGPRRVRRPFRVHAGHGDHFPQERYHFRFHVRPFHARLASSRLFLTYRQPYVNILWLSLTTYT